MLNEALTLFYRIEEHVMLTVETKAIKVQRLLGIPISGNSSSSGAYLRWMLDHIV